MKRICRTFVLFCLAEFFLLTPISIAPAAETGPFYVGVFGGYVIPDELKLEGSGFSEEVKFDKSWALGAKTGYVIPAAKWLVTELEYAHLVKPDINDPRVNGDARAHNMMANLLLRYPGRRLYPFAGVGIGWSWTEIKANVLDESDNAFAWQLMTGVNYEIMPNWSADFAYRYLNSKYESENVEAKDQNHAVLLGVNYHF